MADAPSTEPDDKVQELNVDALGDKLDYRINLRYSDGQLHISLQQKHDQGFETVNNANTPAEVEVPVDSRNDLQHMQTIIGDLNDNPDKKNLLFKEFNSNPDWQRAMRHFAINGQAPGTVDDNKNDIVRMINDKVVSDAVMDKLLKDKKPEEVRAFHDKLAQYQKNGVIAPQDRHDAMVAAQAAMEHPGDSLKGNYDLDDAVSRYGALILGPEEADKFLGDPATKNKIADIYRDQHTNEWEPNSGVAQNEDKLKKFNDFLNGERDGTGASEKQYKTYSMWTENAKGNPKTLRQIDAHEMINAAFQTGTLDQFRDSLKVLMTSPAAMSDPQLGKTLWSAYVASGVVQQNKSQLSLINRNGANPNILNGDSYIEAMRKMIANAMPDAEKLYEAAQAQYKQDPHAAITIPDTSRLKPGTAVPPPPGSAPGAPGSTPSGTLVVPPGTVVPPPPRTPAPAPAQPGRPSDAAPGAPVQLASLPTVSDSGAPTPATPAAASPIPAVTAAAPWNGSANVSFTTHGNSYAMKTSLSDGSVYTGPGVNGREYNLVNQYHDKHASDGEADALNHFVRTNPGQVKAYGAPASAPTMPPAQSSPASPPQTAAAPATSPIATQPAAHKPGDIYRTADLKQWDDAHGHNYAYQVGPDGQSNLVNLESPSPSQPPMSGYAGNGPNFGVLMNAGVNIGVGIGIVGGVGPDFGTPGYTLYQDHTRYNTRQITGGLHIPGNSVVTRFNPGPRR